MNGNKLQKIDIFVYLWTCLILSLFLRNLSPLHTITTVFFLLYIIFYLIVNNYKFFPKNNNNNFILYLFFFLIFFQIFNSFFFLNKNEYFKALPRFLLMPLTFFIFYFLIKKKSVFINIFKIYVFFYFLGSISLIYQIIFNEKLLFLPEPHEREGLARFPTTLGSINAFSSAIFFPCLIVFFFFKNFFLKNLLIYFFLSSALFTLSKSGLVNIFFFLLFLLFKKRFFYIFLLIILFNINIYFSDKLSIYFFSIIKSMYLPGITDNTFRTDSLINQIYFRLNLNYFIDDMNLYKFLIGYGIVGGQGVFGLPFAFTGTTHNQFYDLITIFGIFGLVCFIYILKSNLFFLFSLKKKQDQFTIFFILCILVSIINMLFFNGFIFHPYTSFFIWTSIVYQINNKFFK
jgi:hypothetical protein